MDNQTSARSSKVNHFLSLRKSLLVLFVLIGSVSISTSQTIENPITTDITITASIPTSPTPHPDTPPKPTPGPVNTSDTTDVAIFKGYAYPGSIIFLLKSGIIIASIPAHTDGSFEIHVKDLTAGVYNFALRAEDSKKLTSKLVLFTVLISPGIVTTIDGILMPPTITSDKLETKKPEPITFSGSGIPLSELRLSILSKDETLKSFFVNASGTWNYTLNTSSFLLGDYTAKIRSITGGGISLYSDPLPFRIGSTTRMRPTLQGLIGFRKRCDLNDDGRVNLLDFSIMAFWYKRLGFPQKVDLNTDSKVNLTDLSILAYCWTG